MTANTTTAIAPALPVGNAEVTATCNAHRGPLTEQDLRAVSPALNEFTVTKVAGDLWMRPGLNARDRSIVTVAALIARNQTILQPEQFALALDNGVTPGNLSEIITHLAFYAGWGNAIAAAAVTKEVFVARGVTQETLPSVDVTPLPIDERAEADRAMRVADSTGPASPGLVRDTTEVLFGNLWLRAALAPRDRSLVTVSALIATGQVQQIPFHLNRAMDNGLSREQTSEVVSHLAYYAGWPSAFSAAPVVRAVFEARSSN